VKFKQYLKSTSKKDIMKRFKKLKKMNFGELNNIANTDFPISESIELIKVILFEEFREEDVESAFINKEIL